MCWRVYSVATATTEATEKKKRLQRFPSQILLDTKRPCPGNGGKIVFYAKCVVVVEKLNFEMAGGKRSRMNKNNNDVKK